MTRMATVLGAALLAIFAPASQAALQVSYSLNGGGAVVCASTVSSAGPADCPLNLNIGGVILAQNISGSSNSPGTPANAQQFSSTLRIQNTSGAQQTLTLWFAAQDFTLPTTPPPVSFFSNLSLTSTTGIGTAALTSCIDTSNGLAPPTGAFCSAGSSLTSTTLAYNGAGANSDDKTSVINSITPPFSMSQRITLVLGAGSNINVIASAILTPVPEPASVALLLGVMALTAKAIRRKASQS